MTAILLAAALVAAAVGGPPGHAEAEEYRGQRGYVFLARGANPLATRWFRAEHERHPDMAGPLAGMALAECRLGRDADAEEHLAAARAADASDPLVFAASACRSAAASDLQRSEEQLESAWAASRVPFHGREYARFLLYQGETAQSGAVLTEMVALGWSDDGVRKMLARVQLIQGEPEQSLAIADEILDQRPRATSGGYILLLHELAGVPAGPGAGSTDPRMVTWSMGNDVVLARAEILRRQGQLDEAEQEAGRRKMDPEDPFCWSVLARLAVDLGDLSGAQSRVEESRRRWPSNASVRLTEAYLALARGETEIARACLADAVEWGVPVWDAEMVDEVERRMGADHSQP